jgi:hypothetical protein
VEYRSSISTRTVRGAKPLEHLDQESSKRGIPLRGMKASYWQLKYFAEQSVRREDVEFCYRRLAATCKGQPTYEGEKLAFLLLYLQLVLLTEQSPEVGTVVDILREAKMSKSAKDVADNYGQFSER